MPKLKRSASKEKKAERMEEEMHKFKKGKLHSGTGKKGEKREEAVENPKQAIAIGLSESGQSKKKYGKAMRAGKKRAKRAKKSRKHTYKR